MSRPIPHVLSCFAAALCIIACAASELPASAVTLRADPSLGVRAGRGEEVLPTVDMVLERYIEAVGGRDAIEKLETRRIEGRFTKDLSWDDPPYESYRIVILAKSPDKMLIDEFKPGGRRREAYDGHVGWVEDEGGVTVKDELGMRKLAWSCDPQGALHVERYFPDLSLNREESGEGSQYYVLESSGLPHEHYALYFEKKTGLIARIGYHWSIEDYRQVDGVLVPKRVVAGRKGGSCTYGFEDVRHNEPVPDSIFSPSRWPDR